MIIYEGTCESFQNDILNGIISSKIEQVFIDYSLGKRNISEINSWKNSLPRMSNILSCPDIPLDVRIAIEFQIPLTSKRVDFMIAGSDGKDDNVIVIELKQWEKCKATSRENIVLAYTGGAEREVVHPSQQAYSYSKLIENFNETVQEEHISIIPCSYLHNYENKYRDQLFHEKYKEVLELAPSFIMEDGFKLREYIKKYIKKPSNKNLFELIDHGKLRPSKSLQSAVGSILNGNKEFELIDEQMVAYSTVLKLVENTINSDEKATVIVQGGPGTGKSVVAINLLAKILNNGKTCFYVTKNSAPRSVFSSSFVKGKYSLSYLKGLFKSSGSFVDCPNNMFDCLLIDEAHRLNEKSGLFSNKGENQIKELIKSSKISVFFIDEDQIISSKDIGTIKEIKRWANLLNSKVYYNQSLVLSSQFRCNGSDGYLAFLDDVLEIRNTANFNSFDLDYDIRLFEDPILMREELRKKNVNNKARMIAGYCYPWNSKKDKTQYDIFLSNGFKAQWNFSTTDFAIDVDSFEQVGCIHSTQGIEFDYVGIIIGLDLRYENNKVVTNKNARAKDDATIKTKGDLILADRIIRNTYKTLLSRGQKGCFIYCEDKKLYEYLKLRLSKKSGKLNG